MQETDLLLMSLVIFVPAIFALGLVFFPRGSEESMRWWALAGTALTLGISLSAFVKYKAEVVDMHVPVGRTTDEAYRPTYLNTRVAKLDAADATAGDNQGRQESDQKARDWVSRKSWIKEFNVQYFVGADGISMSLILLTTVISFLAMIASWGITKFVRGYCMLFLVLETGMLGVFLSLDFFLFFIFWEVMLLPMYFLIGVWGGPRREYAAIKFFLYTLLGGVFMMIVIFAFYFTDVRDFKKEPGKNQDAAALEGTPAEPVNSFDLILLARAGREAGKIIEGTPGNALDEAKKALTSERDPGKRKQLEEKIARLQQPFFQKWFQTTMFLLLFIGFAIKLPMFPFHTWLPDAHVEAPTPISMILAGVLLKMGGYGILRIAYPICPWAAKDLAFWVGLFGIISIVYGAFAAMAQTDFKKLVAYSSVSHMGYVLLGIAAWPVVRSQSWEWGVSGAVYQMLAHGVTSAGMFFLVGVIYDRAHHRNLDNFRGLNEPMPLYAGVSAIIFFGALGLPGLAGFVGEFWVVLSAWNFNKAFAVLAALTVVITAAYILWTVQRVYLGTNPAYKDYSDMNLRETSCAIPLVVLCILLGVLPTQMVFSWVEPSVYGFVQDLYTISGS